MLVIDEEGGGRREEGMMGRKLMGDNEMFFVW